MMLGPTTYAFSAMLVAFIAGLGDRIGVRGGARGARDAGPAMWLGAAMIATARRRAPRLRARRSACR